ncbi:hypothetical protein RN607_01925 [Demequina capsici]|uniref:Uncharacterized protein n=1 Tax=Demequina capsici TaxID=3075620 RepID=A0AA96FD89_9MICO|nr:MULTISPECIES: hypothetical protein [unclassified Demequina]WNM24881.1 hypothetical protein RN606_01650 [Demequina sp. OYTSA14]WNM27788.1 hypothetical protein RN607_01925 [Demequina sp. PMTSA13]
MVTPQMVLERSEGQSDAEALLSEVPNVSHAGVESVGASGLVCAGALGDAAVLAVTPGLGDGAGFGDVQAASRVAVRSTAASLGRPALMIPRYARAWPSAQGAVA